VVFTELPKTSTGKIKNRSCAAGPDPPPPSTSTADAAARLRSIRWQADDDQITTDLCAYTQEVDTAMGRSESAGRIAHVQDRQSRSVTIAGQGRRARSDAPIFVKAFFLVSLGN
jgi:hypothetical protein